MAHAAGRSDFILPLAATHLPFFITAGVKLSQRKYADMEERPIVRSCLHAGDASFAVKATPEQTLPMPLPHSC